MFSTDKSSKGYLCLQNDWHLCIESSASVKKQCFGMLKNNETSLTKEFESMSRDSSSLLVDTVLILAEMSPILGYDLPAIEP